jgi:hypothetical protein
MVCTALQALTTVTGYLAQLLLSKAILFLRVGILKQTQIGIPFNQLRVLTVLHNNVQILLIGVADDLYDGDYVIVTDLLHRGDFVFDVLVHDAVS